MVLGVLGGRWWPFLGVSILIEESKHLVFNFFQPIAIFLKILQ
jgi:hypothetical protein